MMETGIINCEKNAEQTQFQQELNRLFESRGIIADLRSHLRHLMVTALQSVQVGMKTRNGSSPKAQALNLLVGEYLFRHSCDYTLSVFTSEVPTLANFSPESRLRGEKTLDACNKRRRRNYFQENEVDEIFNALGMSSREEELNRLKSRYLEKDNDLSLVELFLEIVVEMSAKLQVQQNLESYATENERTLSKKWSSRVVDILLSVKMTLPQITALEGAIFRVTENEMKRIVEEERKLQTKILLEREKRIQDYLKKHESEIFLRLVEAEKDLKARTDLIEEELTEREKHLIQMAVEWKNKHEEILRLTKNFHNIENENKSLQKKLKELKEENLSLKTSEKSQTKTIDDLQEEMNLLINRMKEMNESNFDLNKRIQVLMKRDNEEVLKPQDRANQKSARTEEIPLLWLRNTNVSYVNCNNKEESERKVKSNKLTLKSPLPDKSNITELGKTQLCSGDAEPTKLEFTLESSESEDETSSFEDIMSGVRNKLEDLEKETQRINQNYLEYKLKCCHQIPVDSDSESSKNPSPEVQTPIVTKETRFSQTVAEDTFTKIQKLNEKKEKENFDILPVSKPKETILTKEVIREPTRRQLQNREFFLKSRQLLQVLENLEKESLEKLQKSSSGSSMAGDELQSSSEPSVQKSEKKSPLNAPEVSRNPSRESLRKDSSSPVLKNDFDCLALLEEARIKSPQKPLRQNILLSESEGEERNDEEKLPNNSRSAVSSSESSLSAEVSVGKKNESDGFW